MRRVLIVDDERTVADTLGLIFAKNGFETRTAYSASEAMQCAGTFDPELMLCDLQMPEKDGVELICEMDGAHPRCRILVLTGAYSSMTRVLERASALRRKLPILSKPCLPEDVLREAGLLLLA